MATRAIVTELQSVSGISGVSLLVVSRCLPDHLPAKKSISARDCVEVLLAHETGGMASTIR